MKKTTAAPIAIIDFGGLATTTTSTANSANFAARAPAVPRVRVENVMTSAAVTPEELANRSYWRRVKDKAFGKAHVRCGRD